MSIAQTARTRLRPAVHASRRVARRGLSRAWVPWLRLRNRLSSASVVGDAAVVVSLTSHGQRIGDVFLAVESIGAGSTRPQRIILWLDDAASFASLPKTLERLRRRGLEICLTSNYGPHTKYFPYVSSVWPLHTLPLATADDDILYPRYWLARLIDAHRRGPDTVHCYRASVVLTDGDTLAAYDEWPRCRDATASITRFATGVSGVIYPPHLLDQLRDRGAAFVDSCPRNDDVWLHWVALQGGTPVRQLSPRARHFPVIPGSQGEASLVAFNVHGSGNDGQIAAVYSSSDVSRLVAARAGQS